MVNKSVVLKHHIASNDLQTNNTIFRSMIKNMIVNLHDYVLYLYAFQQKHVWEYSQSSIIQTQTQQTDKTYVRETHEEINRGTQFL